MHNKQHNKKHSKRKRKQHPYQVSDLFTIYAQAGGALENEIAIKKKELSQLQKELAAEKSAERKEKLLQGIAAVQGQISDIQEKMKQLLRTVAQKASGVASSLSSGMKSIGTKISSSIKSSSLGKMVKSKIDEYRDNKVIKDYYALKAKILFQIQQLKTVKKNKDEICKKISKEECNSESSSQNQELFKENIGDVPELSYTDSSI